MRGEKSSSDYYMYNGVFVQGVGENVETHSMRTIAMTITVIQRLFLM